WSLGCTAANLVLPDAMQTHLFADDEHLSTAGQKIQADYYYSLLAAPSLISFLAENAVKSGATLLQQINNQLAVSSPSRGPYCFNAWVSGQIGSNAMDNYRDFPDDPNHAGTLTAGIDYRVSPGLIVGLALSAGTLRAELGTDGKFQQDEYTAS